MSEPVPILGDHDPYASENGRPMDSHDRHLGSGFARELHAEHMASICPECGCCWCCDDDCCAESICSNTDCGCSDKTPVVLSIPRLTQEVTR